MAVDSFFGGTQAKAAAAAEVAADLAAVIDGGDQLTITAAQTPVSTVTTQCSEQMLAEKALFELKLLSSDQIITLVGISSTIICSDNVGLASTIATYGLTNDDTLTLHGTYSGDLPTGASSRIITFTSAKPRLRQMITAGHSLRRWPSAAQGTA